MCILESKKLLENKKVGIILFISYWSDIEQWLKIPHIKHDNNDFTALTLFNTTDIIDSATSSVNSSPKDSCILAPVMCPFFSTIKEIGIIQDIINEFYNIRLQAHVTRKGWEIEACT